MSIEQVHRQRHVSRVAATTLACWYLLLALILVGTISVIFTRPGWEVKDEGGWGDGMIVLASAIIGLIALGAGYTFGGNRLAKHLGAAENPDDERAFRLGTRYAVVGLIAAGVVIAIGAVVVVVMLLLK